MRVLISNPPAYFHDPYRHFIQAGSRWSFSFYTKKPKEKSKHYLPYPFFIGYSSSLLKRDLDKVEVKALDACALDFDEESFIHYIENYKPDLLVVEVPTISFPFVIKMLEKISGIINCKIALAGSHVTALSKEIMNEYPFIDYILIGEYELTLKELVNNLFNGIEIKNIKGLVYRNGKSIVDNGRRELLTNLDYLPFPDREDLPIECYHDFEIVGEPCIQMWSTRGCPFSCIFCVERQVIYASPLYRKRDPIKVVDEMEFCLKKYNAKQIYFDDETMTVDRKHVRAISEEIIKRKLDIPWACMADITIDMETLNFMSKSGCVGIKFGIETISNETLKTINKKFIDLRKAEKLVKWCKERGIWTHATYMVGLPGDTAKNILATLDFAKKLKTDSIQVSIATPFPGTPFFELAEKNGWLISHDWTLFDGANYSVLNYPYFSKHEIEKLSKYFSSSWEKKKKRDKIKKAIFNPKKLFQKIKKHGIKRSLEIFIDSILK